MGRRRASLGAARAAAGRPEESPERSPHRAGRHTAEGVRESGGCRALPASGGASRGRLGPGTRGLSPLEAGPGKPLGRPESCPRRPRPAPAGPPHPAGGAGGARAVPPRRGAGGRRRRSTEGARPGGTGRPSRGGRRRQCGPSPAGSAATRRRQGRAGTGRGAGCAARRGTGLGWAPSRGAAAPSQPAGGAGRGGAPLRNGARGGEGENPRRAARSASGPRGAAWGRRGGACRPEAVPGCGLAAVRLYRCRRGAGRPGWAEGARRRAAPGPLICCGNAGGVLALLYLRSRSPAVCRLFGFFFQSSSGFGYPVKSSWDNGAELGVRGGGALSGGAPSVGKMHRHEVLW